MNKKQIEKPFDFHKKPIKAPFYIFVLLKIIAFFALLRTKYKIKKENFKKIKGGCLIIANHLSFSDFKLLIKFLGPRHSYFISSIDEFIGKEWIMRHMGCLPKKVHFQDMTLVRTIVRLLKKGNIVTIYPEATFSFAGVTNSYEQNLGKLAKLANVPVVVLHEYGGYLRSPRWNNEKINKKVPLFLDAKMVVDQNEVSLLSESIIQQRINEYLEYDEYKYQKDNHIKIISNNKAQNINRILFYCPNCHKQNTIYGENNFIKCSNCNANYEIDEYSILHNKNGQTIFENIGQWFKYQKEVVSQEIYNNNFYLSFPVKISRFINAKKGFDHNYALGNAIQNEKGITIHGQTKDNKPFDFEYNEKLNSLIHVTFSVKGNRKDAAFEVHNATDSYLIYPLDNTCVIKVRFGIEIAHEKYLNSLKK